MPMAPRKPCGFPRCSAYATKRGRCNDHQETGKWKKREGEAKSYGFEWGRLKKKALIRDGYLCVACRVQGITQEAHEVDHIKPVWQGGQDTLDNLQSLCSEHHELKTKTDIRVKDEDIPRPLCPVVLVCGPPASGKTSFCLANMGQHDTLIDLDQIIRDLSGKSRLEVNSIQFLSHAMRVRNAKLCMLSKQAYGKAYVIMSLPKLSDRITWQKRLNADLVMMYCDMYECMIRIDNDETRGPLEKEKSKAGVIKWFQNYSK